MIKRSGDHPSAKDCPGSDVLARFMNDELDEVMLSRVGQHVDHCQVCRDKLDDEAEAPSFLPTLVGFETEQNSVDDGEFVDRLVERIQGDIGSFVKRWSETDSDEAAGPVLFPGPADSDAPLGRLAEYEIQELVGSGATGHLYKAFDTRLKRVVAIKILRRELAVLDDARARFIREAHAAANLQSEFIVGIHEIRTPDDFPPYLVMQFVEGTSLSAYVGDGLNPDAAARSVSQMLAALGVAHERGVVHRDVKPSNVLVDAATNKLKLVDFGLARITEQDGQLTNDGVIAGTPAYMSPEQILDPSNVDARTDLYAAGVVLYELLTGERPFRGSVRSLLNDVIHTEARPIRKLNDRLPRDLETICEKAMAKELHRRYQTADEFRADLQRYLRGEPILARPVAGLERLLLWSRRSPLVAGLSAVVCLLVMGGLYGWLSFTLSLADANDQLGSTITRLTKSNDELEVARARAVAGEQRARRHAAIADQQLNIAFDMISALIFDVQDELGNSPETEGLRRRLLARAMSGLERVEQSADGNTVAELSFVMAKSRLGDSFKNSGSTDEALQHYRDAVLLAEKLTKQHPEDEQVLRSTTLVYWNLGDAELNQRNLAAANQAYRDGLTTARALFAKRSCQASAATPLAIGGQRLLQAVEGLDATAAMSECKQIADDLRGFMRRCRKDTGATAVELAVLLTEMGRRDERRADEFWKEAQQLLDSLDGKNATDEQRERLAISRGLRTLVLADRATGNTRIGLLQQANGELQRVATTNSVARESLIESHRQLSVAYLKADKNEVAEASATKAYALTADDEVSTPLKLRSTMTLIAAKLANENKSHAVELLMEARELLARCADASNFDAERQQIEKLMQLLGMDSNASEELENG